ncbi:MAG: hypothetical protein ACK53L_18255, partial [Pirellulaceae bacterium]
MARPIGSSPHVGKPRGGGVVEGSSVWLRSRLHADQPRGRHFSNDRIAKGGSTLRRGLPTVYSSAVRRFYVTTGLAYGLFVCRHPVLRYDG